MNLCTRIFHSFCYKAAVKELSCNKWKKLWDKVFKNGPSKICGRQPLKNLKTYLY